MSPRRLAPLFLVFAAFATSATAGEVPELVLDGRAETLPAVPELLPLELLHDGAHVSAVAFSFDFDRDNLAFDPTDSDADGVPDAITLFGAEPEIVVVHWDDGDADGELDVLLANTSGIPLPEGLILEIEALPADFGVVASWIRYSADPAPSFADELGNDLEGTAVVLGALIFADGFESGTTAAWSDAAP